MDMLPLNSFRESGYPNYWTHFAIGAGIVVAVVGLTLILALR